MLRLDVVGTGSTGNAYILRTSSDVLLLECGKNPKIVMEKIGFDVSMVSGCLLSHEHT